MSDRKNRFNKGADQMKKVYAEILDAGAQGNDRFMDLMVSHLFGEVWDESILSIKERRLFTMGIIAAMGEHGVFEIQCMSALKNGELTEEQLRELAIHAAPYAGYPRAGGLRSAIERAITNTDIK